MIPYEDEEPVLDQLRELAPLYIIKRNNDHGPWMDQLEQSIQLNLKGSRFFIVHEKGISLERR